jgi:uncharacterized membrane protein YczE
MLQELKNHFIVPGFSKKFPVMVVSIFGMGVFLSFLIEAGFGTDPCSFMNRNIASRFGFTLGNFQIISNAFLFVFCLIFARKLIGFGTFFNWIFIGYIADFFCSLWKHTGIHDFILQSGNLHWRIIVFCIGIIFFVAAAATYMNAQLGVAPYDAFSMIISGWLPKVPFFIIRICYDFLAISIGLIASLSNPLGRQGSLLGSMILALSIGPAVTLTGKLMKKLLGW